MRRLRGWIMRFGGFFNKGRKDRELQEELESHIQMHTEDNLRSGMTPEEARRQAMIKFGGIESTKEACREQRGLPLLETLWQDVRFGLRMSRKNPGFTAVAVLTLALGIGANTAIFSMVSGVLLRPLPYQDPDRIVLVMVHNRKDARNVDSFSYPNLGDYQKQADVFEQFGGALDASVVVTGAGDAARVKGCLMSPCLFALLRTPPLLGRTLNETDNQRGAERVVVLSYSGWQRFFGGAGDVLGRAIELDGRSHTVVGVMPAEFKFWDSQVYIPLIYGVSTETENIRVSTFGICGIGRLKAGVSLEQANIALDAIGRRMEAEYPDSNKDAYALARPLAEKASAQIRPMLTLLFGAVGFVLLIACVNVTNLLLARGATRGREFAIRTALGASRGRMFRQLLLETVPVALLGGTLGAVFAVGVLRAILMEIPENLIPAEANLNLSLPVLGFTGIVSLLAALLAGVLPALQASRLELNDGLKDGARGTGDVRSGRVRGTLIVAEVALALTLLVGAGLLVRDLSRLIKADPGFRVEGLLTLRLDLPETRYSNAALAEAFVNELLERARRLPGVEQAGTLQSAPFAQNVFHVPMMVPGKNYERIEDMLNITYNPASADAIQTLGMRLIEGRTFTERDRAGSERVALLNEAAAKKFFPEGSAIGKQISPGVPPNLAARIGGIPPEFISPPWATVVGIVSDVSLFGYVDSEPQRQVFVPFEQSFHYFGTRNHMVLLVRTAGAPANLVKTLRKELQSLDPKLPTDSIQTMSSLASDSVRPQRFLGLLLGIFAALAAVLAAIGIYSVVAWTVAQRTREVGIRLALGASADSVVRRMVWRGLKPVALGIGLGLLISLGLARVLGSQLAQVKSYDPVTYVIVAAFLNAVAGLACWLPARRAAKVDPMVALRHE